MISRERIKKGLAKARKHLNLMKRIGDITPEFDWMWLFHKYKKNRKLCSCHMCGNPRKHFGEQTRQEKLKELELTEYKKNLDDDHGEYM